jgi:hypothetical protein
MQRETKTGREERVKTLQIELHVVSPEPNTPQDAKPL